MTSSLFLKDTETDPLAEELKGLMERYALAYQSKKSVEEKYLPVKERLQKDTGKSASELEDSVDAIDNPDMATVFYRLSSQMYTASTEVNTSRHMIMRFIMRNYIWMTDLVLGKALEGILFDER